MQSNNRGIRRIIEGYVAKRLFGYGNAGDFSYVDQFTGSKNDLKLLNLYQGLAYRCIDLISEGVASKYEPYLYTLDSAGKKTTVSSHPFLDLLQSPNPDIGFYDLLEGSQTFVEMFGEFFWYMVPYQKSGYGKGVAQIYLLRPDKMAIAVDKTTGDVVGYKYTTGNGADKIPFSVDEIIHYTKFNPKNPYRGKSPLEASIEYVMTETEVSKFTRNYFNNNAAMSGVLNVSGKIGRDQWNKFVRQWRERYQGVENAGKVALVRDSQISFTPTSSNLSEMQLSELKQTTVDQILLMFKVPKGLLGMSQGEGLGRSSVETLEYIFAKWTLDNKLGRMDDTIQRILKKYYATTMPGQTLMVGHTNIVPDDKAYLLNYYNQGVDRWITREEIRDRDPELQNNKIGGAKQLFTTVQQIPLEDAGTQSASSTSQSSGEKLTLVKAGSKKKVAKDLEYSVQQKEAYRQSVERNSVAYARQYRRGLLGVLKEQEASVLSKLKGLHGKGIGDDLLDLSDEDNEFVSELMPVIQSLVAEQGQLAMEFAGASTDYQLSQSIINALSKSTKKMAQNFNQETIDQLSATLAEGMNNGESIHDLSDRVAGVYEAAQGYRTDRVARTESLAASNSATLDAYKQTGYVTAMTWFANPGACEYCDEMNGTTVGLEETFVNQGDSVDVTTDDGSTSSYQADYGDVETPPLHPNCSCTIVPVTSVDNSD